MKKIIPPVLFLISILLMLFLHLFIPVYTIFTFPVTLSGAVFIVIGMGMVLSVRRLFSKIDTEIHTFKKPRELVRQGLFRYSRNPIYLGFALCLVGVWIVLGTASPLILVVVFIALTNNWYIQYEEKIMEQIFGEEYLRYKQGVRRWI